MEEIKNYSFYKVPLLSHRGEKITALLQLARSAAEAADALTLGLGAESRTESPRALCPGVGIGSLIFKRAQSSKKYMCIGSRGKLQEYVPNMNEKKGLAIARRIYDLPCVTPKQLREAFGLPNDAEVSPSWFMNAESVFLKCCYVLGEEFVPITEEEFARERAEVEKEVEV